MWKRDRILNWTLICLAVVVVIVLVGGAFRSGTSARRTSREAAKVEAADAEVSAEDQNAVDLAADTEETEAEAEEEIEITEDAEALRDNAITETGSSHEAILFSDEVEEQIAAMTVGQQVAQLFVTTPEALTGTDEVSLAGETTQAAIETYPVGGLLYNGQNLGSATQVRNLLDNTQGYMEDAVGLQAFTILEELGGETHSPLASLIEDITITASPATLGEESTTDEITEAAQQRAEYVSSYGFNTILGPSADASNGNDADYDDITYGAEPAVIAERVEADIEGTQAAGVMAVMRSFPGANQVTDSYQAYQAGIDAGVDCILVSNMPDAALTGDEALPCSLSEGVVTQLRDNMGFDGLLMTSNLTSSRVTDYCSTAEAAVQAVNAGMDLLYVGSSFTDSYEAVLAAVNDGTITENTLHNAVGRILTEKME